MWTHDFPRILTFTHQFGLTGDHALSPCCGIVQDMVESKTVAVDQHASTIQLGQSGAR